MVCGGVRSLLWWGCRRDGIERVPQARCREARELEGERTVGCGGFMVGVWVFLRSNGGDSRAGGKEKREGDRGRERERGERETERERELRGQERREKEERERTGKGRKGKEGNWR